jgi:hypothetical protein
MAGAAISCCSAYAGTRVENGVVIRTDLKPDLSKVDVKIHGPNPLAERVCDTGDVCQTPVLVSRGGLPEKGPWDLDGCSVYSPYTKISVRSALQPALRWVLVKDPSDKARYVFDATYGIELTGNNPQKDLYKGTVDQSGTVFTWNDLHLRTKTISFFPNVVRVDKDGKVEKKCNAADPDVVNEN